MDAATETRIGQWRDFLRARPVLSAEDVAELEGHLRDQIDGLASAGLSADEAFLIAVGRIGRLDDLAREYAREHSDRLWKQLIADGTPPLPRTVGLPLALACAVLAAIAVKLPSLWVVSAPDDSAGFYVRNAAVLVLPFLALFFLVRRRARPVTAVAVGGLVVVAAVVLNAYPFVVGGDTGALAGMHAVVALWFVVGIAYTAGRWRTSAARMDFVRFSGEWFIYMVLLALGGGVLAALTVGVFSAVGLDPTPVVLEWLLPCGAAGAVLVAAWLVEAKQSVIENMAPVLTRVFTPLVTALLAVFVVAAAVAGSLVDDGRTLLITFDVVLLVVVGLLLYAVSARSPQAAPGWFDRLQLLMIALALVVDVVVLAAMLGRVGEFGASANKVASLGLNLLLLANLAGAGVHHVRFLTGRPFGGVERWQTTFLPLYLAWAATVVVVFPPVFGFA